jgi:uncharacterized radical SAM protein YgiQ
MKQPRFLPMSRAEMQSLGWPELDVLLVTGDAYVDHPSFGTAIIGRVLVESGFRVGVIAQPDWKSPQSVTGLGRPRLFAGITAGAMDSMVSNYTANKKLRRNDAYAPGDCYGLRPNRATLIYTNLIKHAFPGLTTVLGGIEASLRRLVHYDYWEDKLRRSILLDAKADILVYGMGETAVTEIAWRLFRHEPLEGIPGTAVVCNEIPAETNVLHLPGFEALQASKEKLLDAALLSEQEQHWKHGKILIQAHGNRQVVVYPPAQPLTASELDAIYALPFTRQAHPSYTEPVPALNPVLNSVVTHRGCFGGCSFCALGFHQGKLIQSRSAESILKEIRTLTTLKSFHGTLTDLGGPSANMYQMQCRRPQGECSRPSCLYPAICQYLDTRHQAQKELLKLAKNIPGVKHVFVASGIRYDLALEDHGYIETLVKGNHVSGALKVAPEHIDPMVLKLMRKPSLNCFDRFIDIYLNKCRQAGQTAYLTAYFIASFPGSRREHMQAMADYAQKRNLRVEQMQDFIPLPMTLAGIIYYTNMDPWTKKPIFTGKTSSERHAQRRVLLNATIPNPHVRKHSKPISKK